MLGQSVFIAQTMHLMSDIHSLLTALLTCKQTLYFAKTICKQCCDWCERPISSRQMDRWPKINTGNIRLLISVDYVYIVPVARRFYSTFLTSGPRGPNGLCVGVGHDPK